MVRPEEIVNALKLIRKICIEVEDCSVCPFRLTIISSSSCSPSRIPCGVIDKTPDQWEINQPTEWKAF